MKKPKYSVLSLILVISIIFSLFSGRVSSAFEKEENTQTISYTTSATPKSTSSSYKIINKSELVYFGTTHYISFPRPGKITWRSSPNTEYWAFNTKDTLSDNYCINANEFPKTVSGKTYYVDLLAESWYDHNLDKANVQLSYTYYPLCYVYCVNDGKTKQVDSFYLQDAAKTKPLMTNMLSADETKGYRIDGWYTDPSFTTPAKIDMSVGKDYYLYPKKTALNYSITYHLDGGTNAASNPASYTIEDNTIILEAPTRDGHDFIGWYTDSSLTQHITAINPEQCEDITLYAKWRERDYKITYMDAYSHNNPAYYKEADGTVPLKEPSRKGYTFSGWYLNENHTEPVTEIDTSQCRDITIYAAWSPNTYKVAYDLNGGTIDPSANITSHTIGDAAFTLQSPTKEDYFFVGWYTDKTFTKPITEIDNKIYEDITLYAKWAKNSYTITYINAANNPNPSYYYENSNNIILTAATRKNYTFNGWFLDENHTEPITEVDTNQCKDITIYAAWTPDVYHITYEMDGGINCADNPVEYTIEDSDFTLKTPTKPGCTFEGWYTSAAFPTKVDTIKTSACQDITLYAKWTEADIIYSIQSETKRMSQESNEANHFYMYFPTAGKVSFSDSSHSSNYGGGYKLDDDSYSGAFITYKTNASAFSGKISAGSHFIYFDGWGSTSVSYTYYPLCHVYYIYNNNTTELTNYYLTSFSGKLSLKEPTIKGYRILSFYRDRDCTSPIESIDTSIGKDWYLYPKTEPISYSVSYDMDGGTNNAQNITSYTIEDADFTLKEPVKPGYIFDGWYTTPTLKTEVNKITTSNCKNITLYAKWTPITTYHVNYEMDGGINAPDNISEYTALTPDFILKEPSKSGYTFDGWYTSNTFKTKITTLDTSSCQDITLYAKWLDNDIKYSILSDSLKCDSGITDWTFSFPTNGKITFSQKGSRANFLLNTSLVDDTVYDITKYNGPISAGSHTMSIGTMYKNVSVSYKFVPECSVYYMYENTPVKLLSYYLSDSSKKTTLSTPQIKGYKILGLYRDRELTNEIISIDESLGKDWYLYPKTEPISYSVTYDMDGGTNNDENITSYTIEDADFILKEPVKSGYTFDGWYTTPALQTKTDRITTDNCKDITLYAKWTKTPKPEVSPLPDVTPAPNITPLPDITPAPNTTPSPDITTAPNTTPLPDATSPSTAISQTAGNEPGESYSANIEPTAEKLPDGSIYTASDSCKYKILSGSTVEYFGPASISDSTVVPDTITIQGKRYAVVSIADYAFAKNKSLKAVTIGKNIRRIGKKAFYNCKKLKKIVIRTKKLSKYTIGNKAFLGIHPKAVFRVPKNKMRSYKKILKTKGIAKKNKIK